MEAKKRIMKENNTFSAFSSFCMNKGVVLNLGQKEVAEKLFNLPLSGGKTLLISLLFEFDEIAQKYFKWRRKGK